VSYDVLNWNEIQSKKLNVYLMLLFSRGPRWQHWLPSGCN